MANPFNGQRSVLSSYEPVRLHFLPTHIVLFYSFLMPWVRMSFLLLSASAGELFYLWLAALPGRGAWPAAPAGSGAAPHCACGDENGKKCTGLLSRCEQGQNHTGLGLQALNGVKPLPLERCWRRGEIAPGWV